MVMRCWSVLNVSSDLSETRERLRPSEKVKVLTSFLEMNPLRKWYSLGSRRDTFSLRIQAGMSGIGVHLSGWDGEGVVCWNPRRIWSREKREVKREVSRVRGGTFRLVPL